MKDRLVWRHGSPMNFHPAFNNRPDEALLRLFRDGFLGRLVIQNDMSMDDAAMNSTCKLQFAFRQVLPA